jgi:hypothetical protein
MPITTYNTDYYDDYTLNRVSDKNYLKILFKPGYSVQVRELNQLQSMLQDQINRLGSSIYSEDRAVLGCKVNFVPIVDSIDFTLTLDENLPKTTILENITSIKSNNLIAKVLGYKDIEEETGEPEKVRFYVKYLNTGDNDLTRFEYNITTSFEFEINVEKAPELAGYSVTGILTDDSVNGYASIISTDSGIFYVNGSFVALPLQNLFVDHSAESEVLTGVISYRVYENIISYTEDETLVDNSAGSLNYTAPGADRYQIDLQLNWNTTTDWNNRDNTIQYVKIGEVQNSRLSESINPNSPEYLYTQIDKTLALRTQEESGNYTVNPFPIKVTDLYNGQKLPGRLMTAGNRYRIENLGTGSNTAQWLAAGVPNAALVKVGTEFIATSALSSSVIGAVVTEVAHIKGLYTYDDLDLIPGYEIYYGTGSTDADKLTAINKAKGSFVTTLEPSAGYVDGYRVHLHSSYNIETPKSRTRETVPLSLNLSSGNYFIGTMYGSALPPISTLSRIYELRDAINGGGSVIGSCYVKSFEALPGNNFQLYVYNIQLNSGKTTANIKSIKVGDFTFNIDTTVGLSEISNNTLIYALPYEECDPTTGVTGATVGAYRYYNGTTSGTTLSISVGSELNETFDDAASFIVYVNGSRVTTPITLSSDGKSATITGLTSGQAYSVIAAVETNTPAARKILTTTTANLDFSNAINNIFTLPITDIVEIISVINTRSGVNYDVTTMFTISDTGRRDTHYTNSKIQYTGTGELSGTFAITYRYFSRSGGGALRYFSPNSYSGVARQYIPTVNNISLRDTLDFRPDLLNGVTVSNCLLPNPNSTFRASARYYLPRIDKVVVNSNNAFSVINGIPGLQPVEPPTPANAMCLYILDVPAYTADPSKINVTYVDNRRYTMRDIANLDKRIGNLEYYTSLSLLERSASEKSIYDVDDNEREKNGIIVDSFLNHSMGDSSSKEYQCSTDKVNGILRPRFRTHMFDLEYSGNANSSNIKVHKDIITLNYTEETLFEQLVAIDDISVQPYVYAQTVGTIELFPSSDNWKDTETLPDRIVKDDSAFVAAQELTEAMPDLLGYDWGDWKVTSSTSKTLSSTTTKRAEKSSQGVRDKTVSEVETTSNLQRTGTFTTLGSTTVDKSLGEYVVDINIIPFMRGRRVYFRGHSFKPNTKLYAYFDGINVNAYVAPITNETAWTSGVFPNGVPSPPFIVNNITPDKFPTPNSTLLAQGFQTFGTQLQSNDEGEVWGQFIVPNNEYLRFRTGEKEFKLTASERNTESAVTYGMSAYSASGLLQTKQETILSVTTPEFTVTPVTENRTTTTTNTVTTFGNWYDPLAQSFIIDSRTYKEGLFLTSIDLYFSNKSTYAPVSIYVVPTENGYPTQKIVPYSRVSVPASRVNVSSNASAATTFTFKNPVYLQADGEYAFVIESPDPEYRNWIAELGPNKRDVTTGLQYTKQEYLGVFFTSSNAATWTAHQTKDLKFTIRRAKFTTSAGITKFNGVIPTSIDKVTITNGGSKYTSAPLVTIAAPPTSNIPFASRQATATAQIDTVTGKVTKIVFTDRGAGYTSTPSITIAPPPTGSGGTTATASVALYTRSFSLINCAQNALTFDQTTLKNELVINNQTTQPLILTTNEDTVIPTGLVTTNNNIFGNGAPCSLTTTITTKDSSISPVIDITRNSLIAVQQIINSTTDLFTGGSDTELLAKGGKALARYITRPVTLDFGADRIDIYIAANRPSGTSDIRVYIRTLTYAGDDTNIYDDAWTLLTPNNAKQTISVNSDNTKYNEVHYTYDPASLFGTFQIKMVLTSNNIVEIPTVKDFRAIATV